MAISSSPTIVQRAGITPRVTSSAQYLDIRDPSRGFPKQGMILVIIDEGIRDKTFDQKSIIPEIFDEIVRDKTLATSLVIPVTFDEIIRDITLATSLLIPVTLDEVIRGETLALSLAIHSNVQNEVCFSDQWAPSGSTSLNSPTITE